MTKISTKKVVIRPGIFSYVLSLGWLTFGTVLLSVPIRVLLKLLQSSVELLKLQLSVESLTLTDTLLSILMLAGFLIAGCGFLWFALTLLRQKYFVSLEGIHIHRLKNSRFIPWNEVEVFGEQATFIVGSNYKIRVRDGKTATFFTAFMARPRQSARALIEAAYLSGADIEFKFVLGNELGSPPYGIFTDSKRRLEVERGGSSE